MAVIIGKGVFEPYSGEVPLTGPVRVSELPELIGLPETYHQNMIAVRENRVLSLDESIGNEDEILIFVSVMGG